MTDRKYLCLGDFFPVAATHIYEWSYTPPLWTLKLIWAWALLKAIILALYKGSSRICERVIIKHCVVDSHFYGYMPSAVIYGAKLTIFCMMRKLKAIGTVAHSLFRYGKQDKYIFTCKSQCLSLINTSAKISYHRANIYFLKPRVCFSSRGTSLFET